ncbi:uncharacterized protein LOC109828709 isoform X1 [Asparagus officinalis]|uniref:uncharacterized protein LOC109825753 isoform X1 n=1 Tax=Asparagus officinalis TaxID=4686 RepID=UPI00098E524E|nr:uncharacterized protein LOC109825753 isoform X1 [Asparagus officinalis]XP_020251233.1 uncharacterized protein LOC109828709 isoform X1 [Asparagus officinalis]
MNFQQGKKKKALPYLTRREPLSKARKSLHAFGKEEDEGGSTEKEKQRNSKASVDIFIAPCEALGCCCPYDGAHPRALIDTVTESIKEETAQLLLCANAEIGVVALLALQLASCFCHSPALGRGFFFPLFF